MTMDNAQQTRVYGCTLDDLKQSIESSLDFKFMGAYACAISMMSDAQEEIEHGMRERARQTINRAKWVIRTYCATPQPPAQHVQLQVLDALKVFTRSTRIREWLRLNDQMALRQAVRAVFAADGTLADLSDDALL